MRLRDDPEGGEAGRALEGLTVADLGTYDVPAGLVAFEAAKAALGTPGAAAGGAGASKGIAGWIVVGVAGVGIAAGGLIWGLGRSDSGEDRASAPVELDAPVQAEPPSKDAPRLQSPTMEPGETDDTRRAEPVRSEPRSDEPPPGADTTARRSHRNKAAAAQGSEPPDANAEPMADEIEHTSRMRAALAEDPALTLELAEEGNKEFRNGMFGRERLAYAILALAKLGRMDEARRRAEAFLKRYPRGPLAESVRAAVGADTNGQGS